MHLKFFTLILLALLFSSCEDRAISCANGNTDIKCDTDGDGLANTNPKETDPHDPCVPVQDINYSGYRHNNNIWSAADCDGDGYSNGDEANDGDILSNPYDINESCFLFNDLKYCETKLDETWLDRNLGASAKCEGNISNEECFGDYYQWGRMTDGHEKFDSATIYNTEKNLVNKFAIYDLYSNKDWDIYSDQKGEERAQSWSEDNEDLLCPKGWNVPEIDILANISVEELDIPQAGYRAGQNGLMQNNQTALWSASVQKNVNTHSIFFANNSISNIERSNAFPVRCIKIK